MQLQWILALTRSIVHRISKNLKTLIWRDCFQFQCLCSCKELISSISLVVVWMEYSKLIACLGTYQPLHWLICQLFCQWAHHWIVHWSDDRLVELTSFCLVSYHKSDSHWSQQCLAPFLILTHSLFLMLMIWFWRCLVICFSFWNRWKGKPLHFDWPLNICIFERSVLIDKVHPD